MAASATPGEARHDRITVREFADMVRRGEIDEHERLELVEGRLVSYSPPHNPPHWWAVRRLPFVVDRRLGDRVVVAPQLPVVISNDTQLEPDLAVLAIPEERYRTRLPEAREVHCIVETSDSSLRHDRTRKLRLYAAAGVPEYWIVDVRAQVIETYRRPHASGYADQRVAKRGERLSFEAFPDVFFTVDELLG